MRTRTVTRVRAAKAEAEEEAAAEAGAPDHAELVEVAAAALRAERLLKRDHHGAHVLAVPQRPEEAVAEPARTMAEERWSTRTRARTGTRTSIYRRIGHRHEKQDEDENENEHKGARGECGAGAGAAVESRE